MASVCKLNGVWRALNRRKAHDSITRIAWVCTTGRALNQLTVPKDCLARRHAKVESMQNPRIRRKVYSYPVEQMFDMRLFLPSSWRASKSMAAARQDGTAPRPTWMRYPPKIESMRK